MNSGRTIIGSAIIPFRMVFLMWLAFVAQYNYGAELIQFGIIPHSLRGLLGILLAPLLHGDVIHILGNTFPLLFLGAILFFFYNRVAKKVFAICYFVPSIIVWIFGREDTIHIGASGVIYGLAGFLVSYGLFRRDMLSIAISIAVVAIYGYLFYGIFPTFMGVSWEAHLAGVVIGFITAIFFRNVKEQI